MPELKKLEDINQLSPDKISAIKTELVKDIPDEEKEFNVSNILRGAGRFFVADLPQKGAGIVKEIGERAEEELTPVGRFLSPITGKGYRALLAPIAKETQVDEAIAKFGQSAIEKNREFVEKHDIFSQKGEGFGNELMYGLGSGLASFFTAATIATLTKSPTMAGSFFGLIQKGSSYIDAREKGKTPEQAGRLSTMKGIAEGGLEAIGLDLFFNKIGKFGAKKLVNAGMRSLTEATQEMSQTGAEAFLSKFAGIDERTGQQISKEIAMSGLIGGIIGGVASVVMDVKTESKIKGKFKRLGISKDQIKKILNQIESDAQLKSALNESAKVAYDLASDTGTAQRLFDLGFTEEEVDSIISKATRVAQEEYKDVDVTKEEIENEKLRINESLKEEMDAELLAKGFRRKDVDVTPAEIAEEELKIKEEPIAEEPSQASQDPRIEEAKKYDSAEDFVESQPIVYHGSRQELKQFSNKQGTFFTDDYMNAEGYSEGSNVYEGYLEFKNPLVIDAKGRMHNDLKTEYGKSTEEIVGNIDSKKYDGVVFKNIKDSWIDDADYQDAGTIYFAFKPNDSFLNESQLIEIWNEAHEGVTVDPRIEEAKKYDSAEEFVRNDFKNRVIAGQDLGAEIGKKVNYDGTITLFHGTSKQNKEKILKEGFADSSYFSVRKKGTELGDSPLDVAKRKFGKDAIVMEINVDARGLESAAAGAEVFSPKKLIKGEDGIYRTKETLTTQQLTDIWNEAHEAVKKSVEKEAFAEEVKPKEAVKAPLLEQEKQRKLAEKKEEKKEFKEKAAEIPPELVKKFSPEIMESIRRRRFGLNKRNFETDFFINKITNQTDKYDREVLPFILEKTDIPEELRRPELIERYNERIKDGKLNALAQEIRDHFDKGWQFIKSNTPYLTSDQIDNYVTHIWDIPKNKRLLASSWFATQNKYLKKRFIPTLKEGIQEVGLKPKTLDIAEIIQAHDSLTNQVISNNQFIKDIKRFQVNGIPLVLRMDKAPDDWKLFSHPALQEAMIVPSDAKLGERVTDEMQELLLEMGVKIGNRLSPVAFGRATGIKGAYYSSENKIRLQRFFSEKTLAHEIGHHLDSVLGLGDEFVNKYRTELFELNKARIESLKGVTGKYGEEYAKSSSEQIAELFGFLFADSKKAFDLAPNATAEVLGKLKEDEVLSKLVDFDFENKAKLLIEEQLNKYMKLPVKVHPEIAPLLDLVFYEADTSKIMQAYDMLNGAQKKIQLSLSLFHHMALSETSVATMGLGKTLKVWSPFKIFNAIFKGQYPQFQDVELAKDALEHGVTLGESIDIPRGMIHDALKDIEFKTRNIPGVNISTKFLRSFNEAWDKALWGYLQSSLKMYGYETLVNKATSSENMSPEMRRKTKVEIAQLINDTYGGQVWENIQMNPQTLKFLTRTMLSADWTYSTLRQALSPTGVGSIYEETTNVRRKAGIMFWIKAGLYFGVGMNALNVAFRMWDERDDEDVQQLSLVERINRGFMWNNTLGHGSHLFVGRYSDGTERYVRWGKQFRELPEMIWYQGEFNPALASVKKIGGKLAPNLQLLSVIATGKSLSGYEVLRKEERTAMGIMKHIVSAPIPFSIKNTLSKNKDFKLIDLVMPSSKGMTNYKAVNYYKRAIERQDESMMKEVYQGCQRNELDAFGLFRTAVSSVKSERTQDIKSLGKSISDYKLLYYKTKNLSDKKRLARIVKTLAKKENQIKNSEKLFNIAEKMFTEQIKEGKR